MKPVKAWCVKHPKKGLIDWTTRLSVNSCIDNFINVTNVVASWDHWNKAGYKVVPVEIREAEQ